MYSDISSFEGLTIYSETDEYDLNWTYANDGLAWAIVECGDHHGK